MQDKLIEVDPPLDLTFVCWTCGEGKPATEYYGHVTWGRKKDCNGRNRDCKVCVRAKTQVEAVAYRSRIKARVMAAYGNACACCGEAEPDFLSIDHIAGRKAHGHSREIKGDRLYREIVREDFPDTYQVLCHNCNFAKGMRGECPHVKARREVAGCRVTN